MYAGGELALNLINNDPHILPEHSLELVVSNSECLPDVAMKAFIKYITNNTIPITAVLGVYYFFTLVTLKMNENAL